MTDHEHDTDTVEVVDADPTATDDRPTATQPEGEGRAARVVAALGRRAWLLPWVLAVLALVVALVATWQWWDLAGDERERSAVERSAGTFMLTLTSWNAEDGMAATREELREAGTDRFAGEVDELFGTTEDLRELEEISARSEADVDEVYVQEVDGERATALAVVTQRLTADAFEGEEVSLRYAEIRLIHQDGWLVDDVELLVDVAQQEAEGDAPGAAPQGDDPDAEGTDAP